MHARAGNETVRPPMGPARGREVDVQNLPFDAASADRGRFRITHMHQMARSRLDPPSVRLCTSRPGVARRAAHGDSAKPGHPRHTPSPGAAVRPGRDRGVVKAAQVGVVANAARGVVAFAGRVAARRVVAFAGRGWRRGLLAFAGRVGGMGPRGV